MDKPYAGLTETFGDIDKGQEENEFSDVAVRRRTVWGRIRIFHNVSPRKSPRHLTLVSKDREWWLLAKRVRQRAQSPDDDIIPEAKKTTAFSTPVRCFRKACFSEGGRV